MPPTSAHIDTFARDRVPAPEQLPVFEFPLPELQFPERLNCASEVLVQGMLAAGREAAALHCDDRRWSFRELDSQSNRIANFLVEDAGLVPGGRVLLHSPNNPMLAACWFGVIKAGGIAVATMPLLRKADLVPVIERAQVSLALCDSMVLSEVDACRRAGHLQTVVPFTWDGGEEAELNRLIRGKSADFNAVQTAADDVAIIAFTSGTTGPPKGAMHFHRDVIASAECVARRLFRITPRDTAIGTPPLAFTFGLGMQLVFPLYCGASAILLQESTPPRLAAAIGHYRPTVCATSPTGYRAMLEASKDVHLGALRLCVSAGEHLPQDVFDRWESQTGLQLVNGLGTTELFHIFVCAAGRDIRPGALGHAVPGYRLDILDDDNRSCPPGEKGRLAVRGPTGCKYLADPRQAEYVANGWNITGDLCSSDRDGYFWYHGRIDDLIVSAGYNISGLEVEQALSTHPAVRECAVVGLPDPERGMLVSAFVIATDDCEPGPELAAALQAHVKATIAPYKYPRAVQFLDQLPRTPTGKISRARLRSG